MNCSSSHELLLWANDGTRPHDAHPANNLFGGKLVVLHDVATDHRACAPQPRFAVHCDRARGFLALLDEPRQDGLGGIRPVQEVHVVVLDAVVGEPLRVVVALVEAHHHLHVARLKVLDVVVGAQRVVPPGRELLVGMWAGKSDELICGAWFVVE